MKNIKTLFFGALIAAMILPFSSMGVAEAQEAPTKYSKNYMYRMLTILEPMISVDDETKQMTLDRESAENYGLSPYDLQFAIEYVAFNNSFVTSLTQTNVESPSLEDSKFSELFTAEVKKRRSTSTNTLACRGNYQNPHPVDQHKEVVTGFESLREAQTNLLRSGYHNVPTYATFGGESSRHIDFAKVNSTAYPDCSTGQFRDQAIIEPRTFASYTVSEAEPNPEVLSYAWPKLWWPFYVEWWHANF